jgi:hypothetical protein
MWALQFVPKLEDVTMYRITLLLAVLLMVPAADVFGQCGGGFFSGRRASYGGCGSYSSYDGCGVSYGSCGVDYDGCVVSYDRCGSCEPDSNTSMEPKKADLQDKPKEDGTPAPKPAPKHPSEEATSVRTVSRIADSPGIRTIRNTKKQGSGYIVLENIAPSAKVIINDHLTTRTGSRRSYESVGLSPGKYYRYRIVVQYSHGVQQVWQLALTPGDTKVVKVN